MQGRLDLLQDLATVRDLAEATGLHRNTINNVEVGRYAGDPRKRRRSRRAPGRFFKGLEGQYRAKRPKLSAKPLSLPVSRSAHYRQANTRTWRTRSIRNQQGAGGYD